MSPSVCEHIDGFRHGRFCGFVKRGAARNHRDDFTRLDDWSREGPAWHDRDPGLNSPRDLDPAEEHLAVTHRRMDIAEVHHSAVEERREKHSAPGHDKEAVHVSAMLSGAEG